MKTAIATIKGVSPYSQSKHYSTEKLPKDLAKDYEARTWRDRLHAGEDGTVFIPPMSFKNCLSEAAKFLSIQIPGKGKSTYTKHFEAGVRVTDALTLGVKKDDVPGEWLFVPADGVRGSGKRVEKCFPVIHQWGGNVTFHILDDNGYPRCVRARAHAGRGIHWRRTVPAPQQWILWAIQGRKLDMGLI